MAWLGHYWLICCRTVLVMFDLQPVPWHYNDVIMGVIAFQITSLAIAYSTVYSDTDQRKHQSSASLAFVRGIHRGPVNSPHKWPVTRKMFTFDDVIMVYRHDHFILCFVMDISRSLFTHIFQGFLFDYPSQLIVRDMGTINHDQTMTKHTTPRAWYLRWCVYSVTMSWVPCGNHISRIW